MARKLHFSKLPPAIIEPLTDTPSAGDKTTYIAYTDPSIQGNQLKTCAIQRIIKYATGIVDIRFATDNSTDQLEFNKIWANRLSYTYNYINY